MKKRAATLPILLILLVFARHGYAQKSIGFSMKNQINLEEIKAMKAQRSELSYAKKPIKMVSYKKERWQFKSLNSVENHRELKHTVWEIERSPYGPFDKIALHRVVNKKKMNKHSLKKKTIMMLPGTWDACGWSKLTDANVNTMIYLAKNGYDVYTMSNRSAYIPNHTYEQFEEFGIDISSTVGWTYGLFREDIKVCVDKIKAITKAKKIFMSGFSRGTFLQYIYASKYQEDIKGLITFDGWIKKDPPNSSQAVDESTYNFIVELLASGSLPVRDGCEGVQCGPPGTIYQLLHEGQYYHYNEWQLASVVPNAKNLVGEPLPYEFSVISDFVLEDAHYMWDAEGEFINHHDGYSNNDVMITTLAEFTRYWPKIQDFEQWQLMAYDDVPYFDYDDNEIDLPAIGFVTDYFCPDGTCLSDDIPNISINSDVTVHYLPGYGHMDLMVGNNTLFDVKEPLLQWLNSHK